MIESVKEEEILVKTRKRAIDHWEVFTPANIVIDMLKLVSSEIEQLRHTFLEPACWNGNFLIEILRQRLKIIEKHKDNKLKYESDSIVIFSSIYWIDLLHDNIEESKKRLFDFYLWEYSSFFKNEINDEFINIIKNIIEKNITQWNTLSIKNDYLKDIKFDVIIWNPPYQISDFWNIWSSKPLYNKFIEWSIELMPKYLIMIVPSRWMQWGKWLDTFRENMLKDRKFEKIVDFKNASDVFPSVDIKGWVNYFLRNKDYNWNCEYSLNEKSINWEIIEISKSKRNLKEFSIFIRDNNSTDIINKILLNMKEHKDEWMNEIVSSITPFWIWTNFKDYSNNLSEENNIKLYWNKQNMKDTNGIWYIQNNTIIRNNKDITKHKVFIPKAIRTLKNKAFYWEPNSVCSATYLIVQSFDTKEECNNLIKYLNTSFVSFLIKQRKITHDTSKDTYKFIPYLNMNEVWTDEKLYKKYNITKEEQDYIEESIKSMWKLI